MFRWVTPSAITALVASSCLVGIEDTASPADGGAGARDGSADSAGSGGSDASAGGAGGSSGSSGNGGAGGGSGASGTGGIIANGGSAGTGVSGGGGATSADCVLPFKDDFEDGTPATFWKVVSLGGASVAETGGKLSVTFPDTIVTFAMAGYLLEQTLDLTACSVLVRVDETPPNTVDAAASFVLFYNNDDYVEMKKSASTLHCQYFIGGQQFYLTGKPYDPDAHRWWRFRHSGGILNWETSSDGKLWQVQAVALLPAVFSVLRIGGSDLQESAVTGSVKLDDFGIPPP